MARSSAAPSPSSRPEWISTLVGKSTADATVRDASLRTPHQNTVFLRPTIEFNDNYREPLRYCRLAYSNGGWSISTPDDSQICETILSWLNRNVDPSSPSPE